MSNILVCCLGNGVVFAHTICSLAPHSMWKMRGLAYMCHPVGCAWHIYVNGRCIVVLFQKNSLGTRLGRCMACKWMVHLFGRCIGWCMAKDV